MGQGVVMSSSTITELRLNGPMTSDVIGTGYNDEGVFDEESGRAACKVEGQIANIVKDRSFEVSVSGSVTAHDRYVMRNGKFIALKMVDWGRPCPSTVR